MTIMEQDHGIPSDDQLAQLVGAATPHFALQIRERVAAYADTLPEGHPRLPGLRDQIVRLEHLAVDGATGPSGGADLPGRPSLEGLRPGRTGAGEGPRTGALSPPGHA